MMQAQMVTYPVILHPDNGEYNVEIPDINHGTWIRGTSAAQALIVARDIIGKTLARVTDLPAATPSGELELAEYDVEHLVTVNLADFRIPETSR
ncbi:hypothetical protein FD30_GL000289 [Levilactobacillus namurensis DSM 19117]|uniref:HicB-like antitoxin of toxin-antitoxin system domain-containing protein n=2 Tax=Levilactobacillus namurensis TaxID=380393 RepID=A0A0R1JWT6_9LACO|nr:hypothetical protein [Levilactobacillus namurensis]KRK73715.1 hypothetical protein FD30_GL000289 [Levilactobacillus namurensis DSM 19117]WNN64831.1 hypothetical protein RIN67_09000 [Levilactobacillus namurensis]HJE45741.1 hypothetical protein [Levilactobacillus namurensis]